jgi:hypothetical protein
LQGLGILGRLKKLAHQTSDHVMCRRNRHL